MLLKTETQFGNMTQNSFNMQIKSLTNTTYFLAMVVTRMRLCPLECWYWVTNWIAPRPPWGIGALCYIKTRVKSKQNLLQCYHTVSLALMKFILKSIRRMFVSNAYQTIVICHIKEKCIWERGKMKKHKRSESS